MNFFEHFVHVAESQDAYLLAELVSEVFFRLEDVSVVDREFLVFNLLFKIKFDVLLNVVISQDHLNLPFSSELIHNVLNNLDGESFMA